MGAAQDLRKDLAEMFTVTRLGVRGTLLATLMSTKPVESMTEIVRNLSGHHQRLCRQQRFPERRPVTHGAKHG